MSAAPQRGDLIAWRIWDGDEARFTVVATGTTYGQPYWTLRSPSGHTERFERLPATARVVATGEEARITCPRCGWRAPFGDCACTYHPDA